MRGWWAGLCGLVIVHCGRDVVEFVEVETSDDLVPMIVGSRWKYETRAVWGTGVETWTIAGLDAVTSADGTAVPAYRVTIDSLRPVGTLWVEGSNEGVEAKPLLAGGGGEFGVVKCEGMLLAFSKTGSGVIRLGEWMPRAATPGETVKGSVDETGAVPVVLEVREATNLGRGTGLAWVEGGPGEGLVRRPVRPLDLPSVGCVDLAGSTRNGETSVVRSACPGVGIVYERMEWTGWGYFLERRLVEYKIGR